MPKLWKNCLHQKTTANTSTEKRQVRCLICKRTNALNYYHKRRYGIDMRANYG